MNDKPSLVVSNTSSASSSNHANFLPIGTLIGEFEIIKLIGQGGFGIVYLARDTMLDRVVALKEFMPTGIADREDGIRVVVRSTHHKANYEIGLRSFINEAKMLAKFSHPALVEVYRFWEANGTAYMAMRYYSGETLRQCLTRGDTRFDEELIAQTMAPIFDALENLHRAQVFHRDVAPDNIILTKGRPVLLDFGSARSIIGDGTQSLTTILKPGYAPIEQYVSDGTTKQGPWTDVYALGGVLYHLATGKVPLQAVSRLLSDPLQTVNEVTNNAFSAAFSDAVAKALAVRVENRLQNVQEFSEILGWNTNQPKTVLGLPSAPAVRAEVEKAAQPAPELERQATVAPVVATPPDSTSETLLTAVSAVPTSAPSRVELSAPEEPAAVLLTIKESPSKPPVLIIAGGVAAMLALAGYWYFGASSPQLSAAAIAPIAPASAALPMSAGASAASAPIPLTAVQAKAPVSISATKGTALNVNAASSPKQTKASVPSAAAPTTGMTADTAGQAKKSEPPKEQPMGLPKPVLSAQTNVPPHAAVPTQSKAEPLASAPAPSTAPTPAHLPAPIVSTPPTASPMPAKAAPNRSDVKVACPDQVPPEFPGKAMQDGIQGVVRAQALIRDGAVQEVTILSGPSVFHTAVRRAMKQYKCINDVELLVTQEFNFMP